MTTYLFNKSRRVSLMSTKRQSNTLIKYFFRSFLDSRSKTGQRNRSGARRLLVGSPYFRLTPDKVIIQLYYCSGQLSDSQINALGNALSQCWNRPIELSVIRINHFLLDRSILAQYISMNSAKYSFNRIVDFLSSRLSSSRQQKDDSSFVNPIRGLKVGLGGRLTTQRTGPRQTTQSVRLGSSRSKVDFRSFTSKNKLGAFTVKVWVSQK